MHPTTERRSTRMTNSLARRFWPVPLPVIVAERVLPLVFATILGNIAYQGAPTKLVGLVDRTTELVGVCAVVLVAVAIAGVRWRQAGVFVVTLALLGLSLSLLFVGSPDLRRSSEVIASSVYGGAWLAYLAAVWNAAVTRELTLVRMDTRHELHGAPGD